MADIELVIKIPEETYEIIKENKPVTIAIDAFELIKNGTPLPKGHNRLIEANENLYQEIRKWAGGDVASRIIADAQTIVEADKVDKKLTCGDCKDWGTVNCSETYREPTKDDDTCSSFKANKEDE